MSSASLLEKTAQTIKADKPLLPAAPEVSVKILAVMNKPNYNVKLSAKMIKNDAGRSAYSVKTATSLRFLTPNPPKDLEGAMARMGMRETYYLSIPLYRALFLSRRIKRDRNYFTPHTNWLSLLFS
ncbi:MAG TPA: HDOD domain-containing protein [Cycloclasticus sp.]|jgi:HD-like signal output (HDOD) protein|nr:HDOD domain-containing protein [Cycloclasticus sp.]